MSALLCGDCGRLAWTEAASGASPHRREGTASRSTTCEHCGASSWIRVGTASTAASLHASDHADDGRGRIARHALVGSAAGAGLGLLVVSGWPIAVVAGLTGLVAGLFAYREHRKLTPSRPALPARWLMALPPASETQDRLEDDIVADERCRAPLTGRTCVAYEVGLAKDEQPPRDLHGWVLLEQHIVRASVGGRSVDATRTHLDLARERIGTVATVSRDEVARAFLRQRGFGPESDALHVFESVLECDARVSLEQSPHGDRLRPIGPPAVSPQ